MSFLHDCDRIANNFSAREIGAKVIALHAVDSTNTFLKAMEECEHGTVVVAEEQTAGRGKEGRTWRSDAVGSLTFSVALDPVTFASEHGNLPLVTITAAVAVAEAVEGCAGVNVELKWPNDGMLSGKKFFGVLTEARWNADAVGRIVLGIGVNVNTKIFSDELSAGATSIALATGRDADRVELLAAILHRLNYYISPSRDIRSALEGFRKRDALAGLKVSVISGVQKVEGFVRPIAANGAFRIETTGGISEIFAGDIQILQ